MNIYNAKKDMLASSAPRYEAWSLHIYPCLGKALCTAAVRTLSLCARDIDREYLAQFTSGSVTV
jgi:hypothetical protein